MTMPGAAAADDGSRSGAAGKTVAVGEVGGDTEGEAGSRCPGGTDVAAVVWRQLWLPS